MESPGKDAELQWTREFEYPVSSIVGEGGAVYTGGDRLVALDVADGSERWSWGEETPVLRVGARNGLVFANIDQRLVAIDAESGTKQWEYGETNLDFSAPTIVNETVLVGAASQPAALLALDAATGETRWTVTSDAGFTATAAVDGDTAFIVDREGMVTAHALDTGQQQWQTEVGGGGTSSPTVVGELLFIGGEDTLYALDRATGDQQWTATATDTIFGSPAVANGSLFVPSGTHVSRFSVGDGTKQWETDLGAQTGFGAAVGPTYAYLSSGKSLYAVARSDGSVAWQHEFEIQSFAAPALVDGTVLTGTGLVDRDNTGTLAAFT